MHQNLLNAEFVSGVYRMPWIKYARYPGHENSHKGAAQELLLHILQEALLMKNLG
jgi:hypothetical protein